MSLNLAPRPAPPQLWRLQEFRVIRDCAGVTLSENHSGEKRLLILPDQQLAVIYVPSPRCPDDGCAAMEIAGCGPDEAGRIVKIGADVLPEGPHRPDYGDIRFEGLVDQAAICSYITIAEGSLDIGLPTIGQSNQRGLNGGVGVP